MPVVQKLRERIGDEGVIDRSGEQLLLRFARQLTPDLQRRATEQGGDWVSSSAAFWAAVNIKLAPSELFLGVVYDELWVNGDMGIGAGLLADQGRPFKHRHARDAVTSIHNPSQRSRSGS